MRKPKKVVVNLVGTVIIEMVDEKNVVVIVLEVEGIMYVVDVVFLVVMVGKNKGLVEKLNVVDDDDKGYKVEGKIVYDVPKG